MRKAEIDALVRAHQGRVRPVALFHVLRQATLDVDDRAFLSDHIHELGYSDLLRWKTRCAKGFTGEVIRHLASLAIEDPAYFAHDVLDVPRLDFDDQEWTELADLLRGKVPPALYARILDRRRSAAPRSPGRDADPAISPPRALDDAAFALELRDALASLPTAGGSALAELLTARSSGDQAADEAAMLAAAMERARASVDEDWSFVVLELPGALGFAILEKARHTRNQAERANLLGWLEAHGTPRGVLLDVALSAIREGDVSYGLVMWLTRQLGTRAAWDKYGLAVLSALLSRRAFAEIGEVCTVVWSLAGREGEEPPRALLEAMQTSFALALLGLCREALGRGDEGAAMAALSALACLDPPSRVSRAVHDLRRTPDVSTDVAALLAVNERLFKHSDARDASLEGVIAALHALADSSS
jgi:hypothetical protein